MDYSKEPWAEVPHHETAIGTDTETSGSNRTRQDTWITKSRATR